jgi:hypothetical protein
MGHGVISKPNPHQYSGQHEKRKEAEKQDKREVEEELPSIRLIRF